MEQSKQQELSAWMQEALNQYRTGLLDAHRQGLAELLKSKDTVQEITLETGQKFLVAYDQNPAEKKRNAGN
jgi:hypothetical protein